MTSQKQGNPACDRVPSNYPWRDEEKFSMKSRKLQSSALKYAERRLPVFPCKPKGKAPLTTHGFKDASTNFDLIASQWDQWPNANIGVPTGRDTFWVLDIDGEEGEKSLRKLENRYSDIIKSVEVITGSGGRHIYFQWPEVGEISNSAGMLGLGLDVRGNGGYVIVPPSVHQSGKCYEWGVDSTDELRPAPLWLLELLHKPFSATRTKSPEQWRTFILGACEGQRNDAIARIAGMLLRRGVDSIVSVQLCLSWNASHCTPPLSPDEVIRTVNSIAKKELQRRRNR